MAVVVYDITNRATFLNADKWISDVRNERGDDVVIMLVGNKTDLSDKRQVSVEDGEEKAKRDGLLFIECSAKAGFNVKSLFRKLAESLPGGEGGGENGTNGSSARTASGTNGKGGMVDIKLSAAPANLDDAGGCAC